MKLSSTSMSRTKCSAGKIVAAKKEFATCLLEEAHGAVKHYHSDTGVFRAELFIE
jgi:hypothetical protein